jgi:hypothetical protein
VEGLPRNSHHRRGTKAAVNKGACNKAPGRDGICLEFSKVNWDSIKYNMLALFKNVLGWSNHGTIKA